MTFREAEVARGNIQMSMSARQARPALTREKGAAASFMIEIAIALLEIGGGGGKGAKRGRLLHEEGNSIREAESGGEGESNGPALGIWEIWRRGSSALEKHKAAGGGA